MESRASHSFLSRRKVFVITNLPKFQKNRGNSTNSMRIYLYAKYIIFIKIEYFQLFNNIY